LEITSRELRVVYRRAGALTGEVLALPSGAINSGRIEEPSAVAAALEELWRSANLPSRRVVLGIPNHDIVTRFVELPDLPERDLMAAARWEVADLIPFPLAETVMVIQRVGTVLDDGPPRARVMLVAGYKPTLRSYLAVAQDAKLRVRRIDATPLALVRAIEAQHPLVGTAAIVQVDPGGVTVVVTTDGGVRFARAVETATHDSTGTELEAELVAIEHYRRRGVPEGETITARTDPLMESLRGSLEYYGLQPGAVAIEHLFLTGHPGMVQRMALELTSVLNVPVQVVDPLGGDQSSDPASSTLGPAVGMTIQSRSGACSTAPVDLMPRRSPGSPSRLVAATCGAAILTGLALAGVTASIGPDTQTAAQELSAAEAQVANLRSQLAEHDDTVTAVQDLRQRVDRAEEVSRSRTAWDRLVADVRRSAPPGASILAISGTGPVQAESGAQEGSLEIVAQATDLTAASGWLTSLAQIPGLTDPWLSEATSSQTGGLVTFTLTARLDERSVSLPSLQGVEL
jgi:type IV pilus assembly protein PilM